MARITSQKAAEAIGNQFDLVLAASERARELKRGALPKIKSDNAEIVTALKEIEEGLYTKQDYLRTLKGKYK